MIFTYKHPRLGPTKVDIAWPVEDHIAKMIVVHRTFYENQLLRYIDGLDLPRGTAIDVGANIGNHAVYFGLFLASHVVVIEPNLDLWLTLMRNLKTNNVPFSAYGVGAGATDGHMTFQPPPPMNLGMGKLLYGRGGVAIRAIDGIVEIPRPVTIIKVDVEGMEVDVLRGAIGLIQADRPHLFLEAQTPEAFELIRAFLSPLGYRPMGFQCTTPVWHFSPV